MHLIFINIKLLSIHRDCIIGASVPSSFYYLQINIHFNHLKFFLFLIIILQLIYQLFILSQVLYLLNSAFPSPFNIYKHCSPRSKCMKRFFKNY